MLRIKGDREVPLFFFTGLPEKAIDRRAPAGEKPNGNQPSRDSVVDPVAIGVILILLGSSTEKRAPSNLFSTIYGQRAGLARRFVLSQPVAMLSANRFGSAMAR